MCFGSPKASWGSIIKSEILGPFAPKSGWIWSPRKKESVPDPAKKSKDEKLELIKSIIGKALLARVMKKGVKVGDEKYGKRSALKFVQAIRPAIKRKPVAEKLSEAQKILQFWLDAPRV